MNETDDAILEFLDSLGTPDGERVTMSPTLVRENIVIIRSRIEKSHSTVARRMKLLYNAGLLGKEGEEGAHYYLTEKGRKYLRGDLDASELKRDDR